MDLDLSPSMRANCRDPADPHIVVAMSGGVDSSVTALVLKQAGYRVSGLFMKNWSEPDLDGRCQWEEDVGDVLAVCEKLGIPVNTVDLSAAYWDGVFQEFVAEYRRGRTPNPDILCNREIKFKAFLDHAEAIGGDIIATGHYAQLARADGLNALVKGKDSNKDQSYFLYAVGQAALARTMFPIGALHKKEVRDIAAKANLATQAKKDSTGICFIGERHFRSFLSDYLPAQPGDIRDTDGVVLGQHGGAAFYTLGQREGLGIGGVRGAREGPWYVVQKNVECNELIVAQGHDHPLLMSLHLTADSLNWVGASPPSAPLRCWAKTRYRQPDQACTIKQLSEAAVTVEFDEPQRAVTPGQSVVFYSDNVCLGGGIIDQVR